MSDRVFHGEDFHMPVIRLSVENMAQTFTQALAVYNEEIGQYVEKGIEQAIRTFDFDVFVRKEAHKALEKAIQSYFQYGEGARIMENIVSDAIAKMTGRKEAE